MRCNKEWSSLAFSLLPLYDFVAFGFVVYSASLLSCEYFFIPNYSPGELGFFLLGDISIGRNVK